MHCKTVTSLLRIRVRGHFVMFITKNHESHYVTVMDNPPRVWRQDNFSSVLVCEGTDMNNAN